MIMGAEVCMEECLNELAECSNSDSEALVDFSSFAFFFLCLKIKVKHRKCLKMYFFHPLIRFLSPRREGEEKIIEPLESTVVISFKIFHPPFRHAKSKLNSI